MLVDVFLHSQDIFNPRNYCYIECTILKTEVDLLGYTSVTRGKWVTMAGVYSSSLIRFDKTTLHYNTDSINNSNEITPIEITNEHVYHSAQEIIF